MKLNLLISVCLTAIVCGPLAGAHEDTATLSLQVRLPAKSQPFPESLAAGEQPGFKFRGTKGWAWTPEQYLDEIPWLVKFKMNFLMNCYTSLFTSTRPRKNEWWLPLPNNEKAAYAKVIRACQANGITFCFCMNPQLDSVRPLNLANSADLDLLFQHYAWAQSLGVKWFSICVDDVKWTQAPDIVAAQDAKMVNIFVARLRERDPEAQMIFCPGPYWGDGTQPDVRTYLQALGREMNPDVYVFWTGDAVVTPSITRAAAESYKKAVNHRLFLWDNYPVNDGQATLNLGPVSRRAPDLCEVIDGYMGNPMDPQNQINRIPLATCADYAYNPRAYDPARSIGQAIWSFGKTRGQRETLKELVETYPGFLVTGGGTGTNPVREKFRQLANQSNSKSAEKFIQQIDDLATRFDARFPGQFSDAKKTLAADVAWMNQNLNRH